jgi:hypothetical protein
MSSATPARLLKFCDMATHPDSRVYVEQARGRFLGIGQNNRFSSAFAMIFS